MGPRVARKVQRRRYASAAVYEIGVLRELRRAGAGAGAGIVELVEAFLYEGHVCMAFRLHGRSLAHVLDRGPLPPARVRHVVRQLLEALTGMHGAGLTHTDVKPGTVLDDGRTQLARLAGLGLAARTLRQGLKRGTRDFLAPEVLLGAPLTPALDLWSLGCTAFELLTGARLFDPRVAAGRHYREFTNGPGAIAVPLAESEIANRAEEWAEQYAPGAVLAGKYRLRRELGSGSFGTVWEAECLCEAMLDASDAALAECAEQAEASAPSETERERADRHWRRAKGAKDLLDLALKHQHIQLMTGLCGPFPRALIASGRYRASYFEADGAVRFRPEIRPISLRDRLRRRSVLRGAALSVVVDFLRCLLRLDPAERPSAAGALGHRWLQ